MQALENAAILAPDSWLVGHALLIDGGRILDIVPDASVPPGVPRLDLKGGFLVAGFIDLQVNGGGGILFNDSPDVSAIARLGAAHRRFGTTGFLPTLITDTPTVRRAAVQAVRTARASAVPGVLGIHLEGPHLNSERQGVHEARHMGPPDEADLDLILGARDAGSVLVTLAPEVAGTAAIRTLADAGVRVSAGHSAASFAEAAAGFAAGITGVTHLYNAMSPLTAREPGLTGAALAEDGCWCGIIADGHHVHAAALRLAWTAKPKGKLFLVTDAMPPVGAEGAAAGFRLGDLEVTVADGRCQTAEGRLAGSCLDMAAAVRHCVRQVGIPLDEALRMASAYPADFLGIAGERGRLLPGLAADLVHLDRDLIPQATWIAGVRQPC